MENATLPAGQDIKVPRDAVGQHLAQGWSVREDQSDAASDPSDGVTAAPVEPAELDEVDETTDPPAEVEQDQDDASGEQAAQLSTDKKGKR